MRPVKDWVLELGYVGSRSHKLLNQRYDNRGLPVEGIAQVTRTVNERRPDQRFFNVLNTVNGSIGYYDAARVTLRVPRWAGITLDASYWWSKAIDLGSSYTNTATGRDGRNARSPNEFDVWGFMKSRSDFDQPHSMLWRVNYSTPRLGQSNRALNALFGNWQLSSVVLLKSGTPFSLRSGSDGPGQGNVDGAGSDRPNLVDPSNFGCCRRPPGHFGSEASTFCFWTYRPPPTQAAASAAIPSAKTKSGMSTLGSRAASTLAVTTPCCFECSR